MGTDVAPLDVVTGAFSYSGAAIARELRAAGRRVRTLTGHLDRAPSDTEMEIRPLDFSLPDELTSSLRGAHTLYNTYWVRFAHGLVDHDAAVANSRTLFEAAAAAGIQRIVHVSITHPSLDLPYPYFRGKAQVEQLLADSGVSYAIARSAILFGRDGVLINNIAWLLRHLPRVRRRRARRLSGARHPCRRPRPALRQPRRPNPQRDHRRGRAAKPHLPRTRPIGASRRR